MEDASASARLGSAGTLSSLAPDGRSIELVSVIEQTHHRRLGRIRRGTLACVAASVFALFLGCSFQRPYNPIALLGALGAVVSTLAGLGAYFVARAQAGVRTSAFGTITLDDERVTIDRADAGRKTFARRAITSGWLEPGGFVHLVLSDGTELAMQPSAPDADPVRAGASLLDALGLSSRQRAARFTIAGAAERFVPARILLAVSRFASLLTSAFAVGLVARAISAPSREGAVAMGVGSTVAATILVSTMLLLGRTTSRRSLSVGTDGVRVLGLGARFIPIESIAGIEDGVDGAHLALTDGSQVYLPYDQGRDEVDRRSFVSRVEAILKARDGGTGEALGALLDPGDRTDEAWLAHLRTLVGPEGDYRRKRIEVADLERVLDDGGAPGERRVGAALALSALGDPAARERVRLAASASTDEALREALELAAEGELDASTRAHLTKRRT